MERGAEPPETPMEVQVVGLDVPHHSDVTIKAEK
jgi:hypothetical protein